MAYVVVISKNANVLKLVGINYVSSGGTKGLILHHHSFPC
jgi:hypothetical protein